MITTADLPYRLTPKALDILRRVRAGDPKVGLTASSVMDRVVRDYLVRCAGLTYVLTDAGQAALAHAEGKGA